MLTTLKLDACKKHFAQLVARSRDITLAELVDELLGDFLAGATLAEAEGETPVSELMEKAWGEHEADRLALLGNRFPELLTDRERVLWQRIICQTSCYWKVPLNGKRIVVSEKTFHFENFRKRLSTYDDMTRDDIITFANEFERQQRAASVWHGNGPEQKTFRAELHQHRQKQNAKLTHKKK